MKNAMHVGEYLKEAFMVPMGISGGDLAKAIDVSPASVSRLINGKSSLSFEMALRLSKAFGNSVDQWISLQNNFDKENIKPDISNVKYLMQQNNSPA